MNSLDLFINYFIIIPIHPHKWVGMFRLLIDSATKQNVGDTSVHAVLGTGIQVPPYADDQQSGIVSLCWWIQILFWCEDTDWKKMKTSEDVYWDLRCKSLIEGHCFINKVQTKYIENRRELYLNSVLHFTL